MLGQMMDTPMLRAIMLNDAAVVHRETQVVPRER
jgi:hypothetical protein